VNIFQLEILAALGKEMFSFCCCSSEDEDGDQLEYYRLDDGKLVRERGIRRSFDKDYKILEQLGKGSTASCYECVHVPSGESFAVKVINKRRILVMYKDLLPQFRREVEVLSKLDHPNIIRLKQVFESREHIHVVTELARGGELFDYLVSRPNSTISEAGVSFLLRQCIAAVAHMHDHGVIHRDIKLENILLESTPKDDEKYQDIRLKIIDFGLAKSFGDGCGERGTAHTFFGTVGYISPEMMDRKSYTKAVDVWALGVVTFVLLCGVFPFHSSKQQPVDYTLRYPDWVSGLSDSAKDLLQGLLQVDPNKRLTVRAALQHPWVSGTTASPRNILSSPGHLRTLLRSPTPILGSSSSSAKHASGLMLLSSVEEFEENLVSPLLLDGDIRKRTDSSSSSSLDSQTLKV